MNNKSIHSLLIWWIKEYKKLGNRRGYNYKTTEIKFNDQNIPIHQYYFNRRDAPIYNENFAEEIIELYPSLNSYIETLSYDEEARLLKSVSQRISNHIYKSKAYKDFEEIVYSKDSYINDEDRYHHESEYEIHYFLESIFIAVLQEYSDLKEGIFSILENKLDHTLLNNLLNKYLEKFQTHLTDIEIIIPIIGLNFTLKDEMKNFFEQIEDRVSIRLITEDEQKSRVQHANTELGVFAPPNNYRENKENIYNSNLIISINEKVYLNDLEESYHETVNKTYEKYRLKVNTILNLLALESNEYNLKVSDFYFKCDGFIYNSLALPMSMWIKVNTSPSNIIELTSYGYSYATLHINENTIFNIISRYNKIFSSSSKNTERIQGAFLRRTRAQMDNNETEGLLDSIIGIEQLFSSGHNSELSFRISLYVCSVLYKNESFKTESKKEIFDEIKHLYNLRSKFVHLGIGGKSERALFYLSALLKEIIDSETINLASKDPISKQIENYFLFDEK